LLAKEREYNKGIAMKLRSTRIKTNITQEQLAEYLGVTFQQVQKYEKGTNRLSGGKIKMLCEFFEVPIGYFFK
jgi:transcriptional regulator with XRE-family HTH domain